MKHFFIFTLLSCLFAFQAPQAQELFNASVQNADAQSDAYDGQPIVYIEGQEKTTELPEFQPIPFTFTQDFNIKTPFGKKTTAAFVPQTTDFNILVQVLGTGEIVVEEYIQLMNTATGAVFSRILPRPKDISFALTKVEKGGKPVQMSLKQDADHWTITDTEPLSLGVHNFKLSYLLKEKLNQKDGVAQLKLGLTGSNWSLPVERFSVLVLFPKKTTVFNQEMLFGKNEVVIQDAVTIRTDSNGNILYNLNHPLPALTNVNIAIDFDKNVLNAPNWSDYLLDKMNHMLFFLCALILVLYAFISMAYIKYHSLSVHVLKELAPYSLMALHFESNGSVEKSFLKTLAAFYTYQKKRCTFLNMLIKLKRGRLQDLSKGLIRLFVFMNIMRKYILTQLVMIALTVWQAYQVGMPLSFYAVAALILLAVCLTLFMYKKGEKPHIQKSVSAFIQTISNKNIGFGLSANSLQALFLQFYPYSLALGYEKEWINSLKAYNIETTSFTFLQ